MRLHRRQQSLQAAERRLSKSSRTKIQKRVSNMKFNKALKLARNEEKFDAFSEKLTQKLGIEEEKLDRVKNQVARGITKRLNKHVEEQAAVHEPAPLEAAHEAAPASHSSVGGTSNEFVWKPQSEKDGNLVVLLPAELLGMVSELTVVGPDGETVIATGKPSGIANGGREHFRFDRSGGSFPAGSTVKATLRDGKSVEYNIPNPGSRVTSG